VQENVREGGWREDENERGGESVCAREREGKGMRTRKSVCKRGGGRLRASERGSGNEDDCV
jgi:hypothetical protein